MRSGYGAALIQKPELVHAMVRAVRAVTTLPVSIKIRVQDDLRRTVELVRQAEAAGVSFVTVHGRTVAQRREPVNRDAIAMVSAAHTPRTVGAWTGCTEWLSSAACRPRCDESGGGGGSLSLARRGPRALSSHRTRRVS